MHTEGELKPMYLVGGFKNGMKMNDIYKLESRDGKNFIWELINIQNPVNVPEKRSGFSGDCFVNDHGDTHIVIFGGTCNNNNKLNDVWHFNSSSWEELIPVNPEDIPMGRSGHQSVLYRNRYLVVFGGMQEVTNELNDLHFFDIINKKWYILEDDNKNASASGSPRNKALMQ